MPTSTFVSEHKTDKVSSYTVWKYKKNKLRKRKSCRNKSLSIHSLVFLVVFPFPLPVLLFLYSDWLCITVSCLRSNHIELWWNLTMSAYHLKILDIELSILIIKLRYIKLPLKYPNISTKEVITCSFWLLN